LDLDIPGKFIKLIESGEPLKETEFNKKDGVGN
jgi:hypothetical protein